MSGAYFLTHAHADHLVGLSNRWDPRGRAIYCSAVTKALLLRKFPKLASRADVRVVAVAPNRACVISLPEATSNASPSAAESIADALLPAPRVAPDRELLTVTALDAGHCPGSVGFFFEGACGRIFHTGDFRREDWCGRGSALGYEAARRDEPRRPDARARPDPPTISIPDRLPECLTRAPLDLLLLDNTYAHPEYAFPTRAEAAAEVVRLVTEVYPNRDVHVGVDSLGKEPLLAAIAHATGAPVRVAFERADAARAALEAAEAAAEYDAREHTLEAAEAAAEYDAREHTDAANEVRNALLGVAPSGVLTSSSRATGRVFALPRQRVTREKLAAIARHSRRRVVGILPTGWSATGGCGAPVATALGAFVAATDDDANYDPECPPVHAVPYSLHAPHVELEALVAALRPFAVVGNTRSKIGDARSVDAAERYGHLVGTPFASEDELDEDENVDAGLDEEGSTRTRDAPGERETSPRERETSPRELDARLPRDTAYATCLAAARTGMRRFEFLSWIRIDALGRADEVAASRYVARWTAFPRPSRAPRRDARTRRWRMKKTSRTGLEPPRSRTRSRTLRLESSDGAGRTWRPCSRSSGGVRRRRRDAEKRTAEDETTISKDANARDRSSAKRRHVPAWMSPPNGPA